MKKYGKSIILLAIIFLLPSCRSPLIKCDGVYQSEKIKDYWHYLRFYKDGTVIAVSSPNKPDELINWFNKEKWPSSDKYKIYKDKISFSTTRWGTVDYEGRISQNQVQLNSYSHINGHLASRKYNFIKLSTKK